MTGTTTSTTGTTESPTGATRSGPDRWRPGRWVLPVALLLTIAPFVVAAVRAAVRWDSSFQFAGDQAIIGLSVHDASSLDQELGPYSRYGWSHPGPAWFYLLAPAWRLFGADDAALVSASLLLHGLVAAAAVAAVHRLARPAVTLVAAGLVLLFVLRLPAYFFVHVWNPFGLLLGTVLFLWLAVRARDGRSTSLLMVVIAGSYLVQTHVGTAPLVAAVGLAALAAWVLGRRSARHGAPGGEPDLPRPARGRRALPAVLALVLVAMWWPPVRQQLTAAPGEGNLDQLYRFFTEPDPGTVHPTLLESLTAVGRLLTMTPYGWDPGPWEMDVSTLPVAVAVGLVAQVLASLVLVAAGRRLGSSAALWTGVVTLVALLAAVASARNVSGTLFWYLLPWVSVLPAVTLVGLAHVVSGSRSRPTSPVLTRLTRAADSTPVVVALTTAVAVGALLVTVSLGRGFDDLSGSSGVPAASAVLDDALPDRPTGEVLVDIATDDRWPIAAGLVEDLTAEGWTVRVDAGSAELFGTARVTDGDEPVRVVVVSPTDPGLFDLLAGGLTDLGTVETEAGPVTLLLGTPAG